MDGIIGREKLVAIFGRWPGFRDGEVWALRWDRTATGIDLTLLLHGFQMTDMVDDRGQIFLEKHTRVTLQFQDCTQVLADGFVHQNVILSLDIEPVSAESGVGFTVELTPSAGLALKLNCARIAVIDAEPWIPPHGVYAQD